MSTLSRFPIDLFYMKKSHIMVKAFNGMQREVMGNIELPIEVRACTCNSKFIVMDINPSYNIILGRPCIQMAGVVPSTLHQKVKFVVGESLIIVAAKEDMVAMMTYMKKRFDAPTPHLSKKDLRLQHLICPRILGCV